MPGLDASVAFRMAAGALAAFHPPLLAGVGTVAIGADVVSGAVTVFMPALLFVVGHRIALLAVGCSKNGTRRRFVRERISLPR